MTESEKAKVLKLAEYGAVNRAANQFIEQVFQPDISARQYVDIKKVFAAGAYFFYNSVCLLPDECNDEETATAIMDNLAKELDKFASTIEKKG